MQEAVVRLMGKRMEGTDEVKVSHCRPHRTILLRGKLPIIQCLTQNDGGRQTERDAFVVSHLEKCEYWERWRSGGMQEEMLGCCSCAVMTQRKDQ